jgi:hypothetical protein
MIVIFGVPNFCGLVSKCLLIHRGVIFGYAKGAYGVKLLSNVLFQTALESFRHISYGFSLESFNTWFPNFLLMRIYSLYCRVGAIGLNLDV